MQTLTATYSPEDNKLRLYASSRLDAATYERVKGAGFKWAPRQGLFVAPMWTPGREDLLLELCGEIGDEDTSLVERAEERADRFGDYSDKRASDAESARAAVSAIADGIPLGQPILVGHHSERRARKDAERIENGMRRAVKMWETAEYWQQRAAGALRHAKYKERPDVRYRRIKGLESDKRKQERTIADVEKFLQLWRSAGLTQEKALRIANYDHISSTFSLAEFPRNPPASQYEGPMSLWSALDGGVITAEQARDIAVPFHERTLARARRWVAHYAHRIAYERALLAEQGGLKAEAADLQPGGRVLIGREWLIVIRVNKKGGAPVSVTTNARYGRVRGIEEIKEYQAPTIEEAALVAQATKKPPLVNYPGVGFAHMTKAAYDRVSKDYKGTNTIKATDATGAHRVRTCLGCYALPQESDDNKRHSYPNVFITDAKRVDPPMATTPPAAPVALPRVAAAPQAAPATAAATSEESGAPFRALREQLRAGGVQVVSAPQLFPTPAPLAARMVEEAGLFDGARILEPEAGTGRLLAALRATGRPLQIVAVEIDGRLCEGLRAAFAEPGAAGSQPVEVVNRDFLSLTPAEIGVYDFILMNPPFADGADIAHIRHAMAFLEPGGRLVGLCANGPRQAVKLRPVVEQLGGRWVDLPAGSFAESGTGVHVALITIPLPVGRVCLAN